MRRLRKLLPIALLCLVAGTIATAERQTTAQQTPQKPNIIFVFTDDQDAESLEYMPTVQRELVEKGTTFENAILTLPVCCPSRATMLRGQYAHNHGIGDGIGGENGAPGFRELGLEESTMATWLDDAGYRTALVGKYLNGYEDHRHVPPGWDDWYAGVDEDTWAKCLSENGKEKCYEKRHPDSVLAEKAERFVRASKGEAEPIFLWLSLNAPHTPARHSAHDAKKFTRVPLPRPPSFDEEDVSDKPEWVRKRPHLTNKQIRDMGALYRDRLRSLQTVDRAVRRLVDALADTGRLENTYVLFWTDNGYRMGQHGLLTGKDTPYVEDTQVPLVVRGPGVPVAEREELALNTDLAPTFAELAGTQAPDFVDGRSLALLLRGKSPPWRTAALTENRASRTSGRPAFAGVRTEEGYYYVEYENGEKELYDLGTDPYQLENIYDTADRALLKDLNARLEALRSCAAQGCRAAEDL